MCCADMLTSQLLELSKQLASSSKSFKITLKTKEIDFTFSSQDDHHPGQDDIDPGYKISGRKKSKSPSQKKQDTERRHIFWIKKLENTNSLTKPSESHGTQQTSAAGNDDGDIVSTHDVPAKKLESSEESDPQIKTTSVGEGTLGM